MVSMHWFHRRAKKNFDEFVIPYCCKLRGRVRYLEIGVWDGDSLNYVLQHALSNRRSRAIGVDPWAPLGKHSEQEMDAVYRSCKKRMRRWGKKCHLYREPSSKWLRRCNLPAGFFHVIYVDGDHTDVCVVDDAVLCWPLLAIGGLIVFDDYHCRSAKRHHVKHAVDRLFEPTYARFLTCLVKHGQAIYKKTSDVQIEMTHPDGSHRRGLVIR